MKFIFTHRILLLYDSYFYTRNFVRYYFHLIFNLIYDDQFVKKKKNDVYINVWVPYFYYHLYVYKKNNNKKIIKTI